MNECNRCTGMFVLVHENNPPAFSSSSFSSSSFRCRGVAIFALDGILRKGIDTKDSGHDSITT